MRESFKKGDIPAISSIIIPYLYGLRHSIFKNSKNVNIFTGLECRLAETDGNGRRPAAKMTENGIKS